MNFFGFLKKNKLYILLFGAFISLLYSPLVFTSSYCADLEYVKDAKGSIYNWNELGRYTLILLKKITFTPYNRILEGILFVITCFATLTALSYLLCLLNKKSKPAFIFLISATALIFPTFAEQYYFKFQSFEVLFGIFLTVVSGIMFFKFIQTDKLYYLPIPIVLNVLSFGIYQSMLNIMLVIYAGIFLMLFLSEIEYDKFKALLIMAMQFLVSFILNQFITRLFCEKSSYFSDKIMWKQYPFDTCYHFVKHYFRVVLLAETPMYTFAFAVSIILCIAAFIILLILARSIKERVSHLWAVLGIAGLIISPFAIAVIQGFEPDSRTQLAIPFSIAFLCFFAVCVFEKSVFFIKEAKKLSKYRKDEELKDHDSKKKPDFLLSLIPVCVLIIILLLNTIPSLRLTYTRMMINKSDRKHLTAIAKDLEKYHCDAEYPLHTVIFIGTLPYECGSFGYQYDVEQKEYILINAFTLDSKTNPEYFFSTNRALSAMECLGYNYNKPKKSNYMKKAKETAANLPSYPSEGYIEESGEFVAVNLGNY